MNKALFIDRDGVINREKGYVFRVEDFEFIDGVFEALKEAAGLGYKILVITNQAGIARGYYSEMDFHKITKWMLDEFRKKGVEITDVYYDPYHPEYGKGKYRKESLRRKPAPGMILDAVRDHHINLQRSVLVGDKLSDIEAGRRAGVGRLFLVRTGHPFYEDEVPEGVEIVDNMNGVVKMLHD
ncbi:MAG: HAD family hydrolase [Bacteroidales bacterium]|nr:HAD family hydrolase [Bacteroidales bacterium]